MNGQRVVLQRFLGYKAKCVTIETASLATVNEIRVAGLQDPYS